MKSYLMHGEWRVLCCECVLRCCECKNPEISKRMPETGFCIDAKPTEQLKTEIAKFNYQIKKARRGSYA